MKQPAFDMGLHHARGRFIDSQEKLLSSRWRGSTSAKARWDQMERSAQGALKNREHDGIRRPTTDHARPVERIHSDAVPFVHRQVIGVWRQTILWIIA